MLETGRRSAISTSELGLYSDRVDRYNRNRYGQIARKFAIGIMVVITVILVAIFTYDFTSGTSANSKVNQETKHIYILQNALKKLSNSSKKSTNFTLLSDGMINRADNLSIKDRSDDENYDSFTHGNATDDTIESIESRIMKSSEPEMAMQNLHNFKQRKRVLKSVEDIDENEESEVKPLFDNHAIVYRMRQRYKLPDLDEDMNVEESQPVPFHWEFKHPHPDSFKRPRYPQLSQYRYPHSSRNIQEIIKYLTNNADMSNRGIKFTGIYVNPKKYDVIPDIGEMMNSDKTEELETISYPIKTPYNNDPFYQYKPRHPADVNLLATSNVRFSPTGIHRYSPYHDPLYSRPLFSYNKPIVTEPHYENIGAYSANTLVKNRKPKPFSVMLDIYPITDDMGQNAKRPTDDYDHRRPSQFNRGPKFYTPSPQSLPLMALPNPTTLPDEDERQQMILHLNLYPRKKNNFDRHDVIHKSELMKSEERQQFAKKIMSPLESIAKHLTDHSAIGKLGIEENLNSDTASLPLARYREINLDDKDEKEGDVALDNNSEIYPDLYSDDNIVSDTNVSTNRQLNLDDDYASTETYETDAQNTIPSTEKDCPNCDNTTMIDNPKAKTNESFDLSKSIDIIEGLQHFDLYQD